MEEETVICPYCKFKNSVNIYDSITPHTHNNFMCHGCEKLFEWGWYKTINTFCKCIPTIKGGQDCIPFGADPFSNEFIKCCINCNN